MRTMDTITDMAATTMAIRTDIRMYTPTDILTTIHMTIRTATLMGTLMITHIHTTTLTDTITLTRMVTRTDTEMSNLPKQPTRMTTAAIPTITTTTCTASSFTSPQTPEAH